MKNPFLIAALLIGAVAAGYLAQNLFVADSRATSQQSLVNERIQFTLPDLQGDVRRLSEWDGTARLVNFWATWCKPCRREIPLLKQLQADDSEPKLQVIGVAVDFMEAVTLYAEEAEFNYPVLVGQEEAMAAAESSGVEFIGLPFTLILSADGDLVNAHVGEIRQEHIDRIVAVLRDLDSGALDLDGARNALHSL